MKITRVRAKNFKSFAELDLELNDLNVFIGANASGKSNFVDIFDFLRNISEHGLENAVSMQGGTEYLHNVNIRADQPLEICLFYDLGSLILRRPAEHSTKLDMTISSAEYRFSIQFDRDNEGFSIVEDQLTLHYDFLTPSTELSGHDNSAQNYVGIGEVFVDSTRKVKVQQHIPPHIDLSPEERSYLLPNLPPQITELPNRVLLAETAIFKFILLYAEGLASPFENFAIYEFVSKLPKGTISIAGRKELEEDGRNLSIVLKSINEDSEKKRKFLNLVSDLLPFINDFDIQELKDKSVQFALNEQYAADGIFIPSSFVSDGTVNMLALIVALYFEDKAILVFEEPERNIHAHLISNLVNMFEDASRTKQLIITTHNPEVVRFVPQENLYLVSRNEHGYSEINRPSEFEDVQVFLQNDIGIEELYVQDLLGVVHAK